MKQTTKSFRQNGNQLIFTRLLDAPRELVWEVWTKPEHISEWWGPNGFSIANKSMEVAPGKSWEFKMSGMGFDFDEKLQYIEVVEPSLLVYKHFGHTPDYDFTVNVSFEEANGKTLLTMTSIFKSQQILDELNKQVKAVEGGTQTLNKMEAYLERFKLK